MLLFKNLEIGIQHKIVSDMWERTVPAGEILIQEGDVGLAASELYVVKEGKFEVSSCMVTGEGQCTCRMMHVLHLTCTQWQGNLHAVDPHVGRMQE